MAIDRLLIRTQVEGLAESEEGIRRLGIGVQDVGDEADAAGRRFNRSMGLIRGGIRSAAGFIGGLGLAYGIGDTVKQGMALQTQQAALQQTLRQTGQAGTGAYSEIMAASERLSEHGGFSTEQNLQAMAAFEHETGSTTESMRALSAATDIARAKHESFDTALGTVRSALAGNFRAVRQLVTGFVPVTTSVDALDHSLHANVDAWEAHAEAMNKDSAGSGTAWLRSMELAHGVTDAQRQQAEQQDRLASGQRALTLLTGQYNDQQQRYAQTTQGRLESAENSFKNLTANLGESMLPEVNVVARALGGLAGFLDRNRWAAYGLVGVITLLGVDALGGKLVKGAEDGAKAVGKVGTAGKWLATQLGLVSGAQEAEAASATEAGAATDLATGQLVLFDAAATEGAAATSALDVALGVLFSPILLIIAAVAALGAGIYMLVTHFRAVEHAASVAFHGIEDGASDAWHFIVDHWKLMASILGGPFVAAGIQVVTHWRAIERFFDGLWRDIKRGVSDVGHAISDSPLGALGDVAGGHLGSAFHAATFGLLNQGGEVRAHGGTGRVKHLYTGGPAGTDTVEGWLTPGEDVLSRAGASTLNSMIGQAGLTTLNAGGNPFGGMAGGLEGMQIAASPVVLMLNNRTLAEGVIAYTLQRAARGPASLVGGGLATGV